ncbi:calcineurin-like phosphoesterase C-terminal domain-containing protein [Limibacter armeniacum]|uniref:calcineurin-like phosphoesterase C-terminal domain-containing protein n=1 Tax=Limibacter armeniacum TaxID=466084 RepID=UPI002FE5FC9A
MKRIHLIACMLLFGMSVSAQGTMVKGRAFVDKNGNGTFDKGEKTLKGIQVSNGVDIVTTNSKGQYSIKGINGRPVFAIKPVGYQFPLGEDLHPRFFHLLTKETAQTFDLPMHSQKENKATEVALLGDAQPHTLDDFTYYVQTTTSELINEHYDFSLMLGDVVGNSLELYDLTRSAATMSGKPTYYVFGNHDTNRDYSEERRFLDQDKTFEEKLNPAYYAMSWGELNVLVLNNVYPEIHNPKRGYYSAGIDPDQWTFLENYLKSADKEKMLMVATHIPVDNMPNVKEFYQLFKGFKKVFFVFAHSHTVQQRFAGEEEGWPNEEPAHLLSAGATCGGHWRGEYDIYGMPNAIMKDGTPRGFILADIQDNELKMRYKATGYGKEHQMHIYVENYMLWQDDFASQGKPSNKVLANVYMGHEHSTVRMRVDKGEWQEMKKVLIIDPYLNKLYETQVKGIYPTKGAVNLKTTIFKRPIKRVSKHIWEGEYDSKLSAGVHSVEVWATNEEGLDTKKTHAFVVVDEEIMETAKMMDARYKQTIYKKKTKTAEKKKQKEKKTKNSK